MIALNYSIFL